MNITLSIDEEILKKVRKIAVEKNTTLTAMVRSFLTAVANSDTGCKRERIAALKESTRQHGRDLGLPLFSRSETGLLARESAPTMPGLGINEIMASRK